jgi:hypothetical protein
MARRKGSRDKGPRRRRGFKPLTSPESGPDLPRAQAQACDCSEVIRQCQQSLAELGDHCASCSPTPATALGTPGNAASA